MLTETATQTRSAGQRGRKGNRGRGGGGRGAHRGNAKSTGATNGTSQGESIPASDFTQAADRNADNAAENDDTPVCWICAEPVKYYSLSECNHRTCHVCALRLRALYKKHECTFCKEPQPSVLFTRSPDALWSSFTPDLIPYKDPKLSISFETQEMMEETLILLRFNCPDGECDYIGTGWGDLKLHTRSVHGKLMCDLCIRFKKVFAHEHALYAPNQLPLHLPSMRGGHVHGLGSKQIEGGVHPLCEFCRECFFGDDELYAHMRERHEECFICKRNEVKDQYFRNYDALELHFNHAHFPCTQPICQASKFVVFGSAIDLKAHMVEEHGAEMSSRDKKDARRVEADFTFDEVGRHRRHNRERDREPPPAPVPPGPPRPNGAGSRRREAFGGSLTIEGNGANASPNGQTLSASQHPSRRQSPSPGRDDGDIPERNAVVVARISALAPNPTTAVPAIQAAIRSFRGSESGARDLISTVWNILDRNLDGAASIVNQLVELIDDEDKKKELLAAWNGFKIEQRAQFPELVPTAIGTQWAGVTSGRVLNAKHSTTARSTQSSRQVLDRVARAAASSSLPPGSSTPPVRAVDRFPVLQASTTPVPGPAFRQPQRNTPWASSSAAASPKPRGPTSVPGPGSAMAARAAPALSKSAFPELPTSNAPKAVPRTAIGGNQSLKKILGDITPVVPAWGSGSSGPNNGNGNTAQTDGDGEDTSETAQSESTGGQGKSKKGKGKQKQTLFTLGSFPT